MPTFHYRALDRDAQVLTDVIVAENISSALDLLRGRGFRPLSVALDKYERRLSPQAILRTVSPIGKVPAKKLHFFYQRMSMLTHLPAVAALRLCAENEYPASGLFASPLRKALFATADAVQGGLSMDAALHQRPEFPPTHVRVISTFVNGSSEAAQRGWASLAVLTADEGESTGYVRQAVLTLLGGGAFFLALTAWVTRILESTTASVSRSFGFSHQTPLSTRIVEALTSNLGLGIIGGLVALGALLYLTFLFSGRFGRWVEKIVWRTPGLGPTLRQIETARVSRALAATLSVLSEREGLVAAVGTSTVRIVNDGLSRAATLVRGGTALPNALDAQEGLFDVSMSGFLTAATGSDVPDALLYVAKYLDQEAQTRLKAALASIGPTLGAIGFTLFYAAIVAAQMPVLHFFVKATQAH